MYNAIKQPVYNSVYDFLTRTGSQFGWFNFFSAKVFRITIRKHFDTMEMSRFVGGARSGNIIEHMHHTMHYYCLHYLLCAKVHHIKSKNVCFILCHISYPVKTSIISKERKTFVRYFFNDACSRSSCTEFLRFKNSLTINFNILLHIYT